jgi:hypothetical protein
MKSSETQQHISNFFESYATALEHYDTKKMAFHYAVPCTFLSDDSSQVFNDPSKLEGLFNQGTAFYKQFGIVHARPEVWSKRSWTNRICKVKVHWSYFDKNNAPLYTCDYMYILKLDKYDKWKIETSVSINEKENMDAWLQKR